MSKDYEVKKAREEYEKESGKTVPNSDAEWEPGWPQTRGEEKDWLNYNVISKDNAFSDSNSSENEEGAKKGKTISNEESDEKPFMDEESSDGESFNNSNHDHDNNERDNNNFSNNKRSRSESPEEEENSVLKRQKLEENDGDENDGDDNNSSNNKRSRSESPEEEEKPSSKRQKLDDSDGDGNDGDDEGGSSDDGDDSDGGGDDGGDGGDGGDDSSSGDNSSNRVIGCEPGKEPELEYKDLDGLEDMDDLDLDGWYWDILPVNPEIGIKGILEELLKSLLDLL